MVSDGAAGQRTCGREAEKRAQPCGPAPLDCLLSANPAGHGPPGNNFGTEITVKNEREGVWILHYSATGGWAKHSAATGIS